MTMFVQLYICMYLSIFHIYIFLCVKRRMLGLHCVDGLGLVLGIGVGWIIVCAAESSLD